MCNGQNSNDGFLYPQYPIKANMSIDIPLSLFAEDLTFIDTTEINLPNNESYDIEKVYIKIDNGLPFETNLQLIFLDENSLVIDTLLSNTIITAAQVDENNLVASSISTIIEIDYEDLENINKMVSISKFNTKPVNQFIDIYSYYELDITLSAKINEKIKN